MNLSYQDLVAFVNVCRIRGVDTPRIREALVSLGFAGDLIELALKAEANIVKIAPPAESAAPEISALGDGDGPSRALEGQLAIPLSEATRTLITVAGETIPEIRIDLTSTYSAIRSAPALPERPAGSRSEKVRAPSESGEKKKRARPSLEPIKIELGPHPPKRESPALPGPNAGSRLSMHNPFQADEPRLSSALRRRERIQARVRRYFVAALLVVLFGDLLHSVIPLIAKHQGRLWKIEFRVTRTTPLPSSDRIPASIRR